jgi:predicted O-methyltransferase YrrM
MGFEKLTAESLLDSGVVTDATGQTFPLHSNTSLEQCRFLQDLISATDARRCLEIGLAYGVSSLAICEAIAAKNDPSLISIDPLQTSAWNNIGVLNLQRAGFGQMLQFHEAPSFEVLPELLRQGRRIDFAYIDSVKVFDFLLVDAFYLTRLLEIGGTMVFDDCDWPGVRKLVRYLTLMPHLEVTASFNRAPSSLVRRIVSKLAAATPARSRIFSPELAESNEDLGIAWSCVAFTKRAEDSRSWDWFAFR